MASKTLKGLTIEIGGETSGLTQALKDVEKRAKSMSKELTDINNQLNFDPSNTVLLGQKQEVLAGLIEQTASKLETLREAEKQVQEQFKRGEVSEEQVRALQREIVATEGQLKNYRKQAKGTADAIEALGKGSDDAAEEVKDTGTESQKAAKKVDDFSDSAKDADDASGNLGSTLANAAKAGFAAVGAAAAAVVGGLVGATEATREYRTEMGKLNAAFSASGHDAGSAADTYGELYGIIGETDQSVEAAQQIALLANSEKEAAQWAGLAAGVVGTFGDALQPETFYESANETLKLGEATGAFTQMLEGAGVSVEDFNAQMASLSTEEERQAYMLSVANGVLGEAGKAYMEANAELIRANEANDAWMQSLSGIGGAMEPVITDIKLMGASLLSELVPGVESLATAFRGLLEGDAGAADALGSALSGLITQLLDKVTELAPTIVDVGMSLLTNLVTTLISQLPQLVEAGSQIIISILAGLQLALPQIFQAIADMIPQLALALQSFLPQFISLIVSLVTTLAQQLPVILPPLIAALPGLIMSVVNALIENLPILLQGVIDLVMMLTRYAPDIIAALLPLIPEIIVAVCTMIADNAPMILDSLIEMTVMLFTEVLPKIYEELKKSYVQIMLAVGEGLVKIFVSIKEWYDNLKAKIAEWLLNVLNNIKTWIADLVTRAAEGAKNFVNSFINFFKELPSKIWTWLSNAVSKVVQFGSEAVSKAKTAAKNILDAVVNGIKELPSKVLSIGSNLVTGLWNGVNNKLSWLKSKIKSFTSSVLSSIKSFFGVHSPSKETAWIGDMLDRGLAEGITDNADRPIEAMTDMGDDILDSAGNLNGLTLQRQLAHTYALDTAAAQAESGLLGKLDSILSAIERGQVLLLDGDALVGATVGRFDNQLGQRRALVARGAL